MSIAGSYGPALDRIMELEAELDAKHAKLVEVADKLRAERARADVAENRVGVHWGTCVDCPFEDGHKRPGRCVNRGRYDHQLEVTTFEPSARKERERAIAAEQALEYADRWILARSPRADHACKRCVPDGPIVIDGFVCTWHSAKDRAAARTISEAC